MILGLIPLLLLAAVVATAVLAVQRRGGSPQLTGNSVRQFFQYLILAGLLFAAGSGLTGLLGRLLDAAVDPEAALAWDDSLLALYLTFTVIALPLWGALAWWTRRRHRTDPREGRAALWTAYLTLVPVVSLLVVLSGWQATAVSLLHGPWRPGGLVQVLVWLAIWWLHRRWGQLSTAPGQLGLERLLGTFITLVAAAAGLVIVVGAALRELLGLTGTSMILTTVPEILQGVALLIGGGAFWVVYWLRDLARKPRDTGWLALVLLAGVGASLVAAVTAGSLLLWRLLIWLVGDPDAISAREHFLTAPAHLATIIVGILVWWYHQEVLAARRAAPRDEVRRVYEYLLSTVGLGAASAGVVMVLVTLVQALSAGTDLVVGGSPVNALLGALVLLGVGLPLWWWHWRLVQQARAQDPTTEVASPTRRFYRLVLFGLMGLAAVIALLTLVYFLLEDGLAGQLDAETLRRTRFAIGVLVTASLLSAYHWTVFRSDRGLVPEVRTGSSAAEGQASDRGDRRVLLVGAEGPDIVAELARRTGSRAQLVVRADDGAAPWSVDALVQAVDAAPAGDLVVVAGTDGLQVLPVRR
ncbi:DUF5671 domain-containing protein [Ornithinimicrobium pratense]|uniref:DUF5671 domain-containing protein n=1 Tax=Ornithinimicrobium pratense TaxID=2593973 RepID=A0A5J6V308_9MICO|nr:DUF5671 domain-containing protein [Ornithinimicrobium pratense]QFG68310.1 hypothetical protein FY030_05915 [Ornithinimicrobium pratense]